MASMASSEERPSRRRSSKALSKLAESLTFSSRRGNHEPTVRRERKLGGFGAEPAAVGDDGVDFAVVGDVAERLREMPGRLRVR